MKRRLRQVGALGLCLGVLLATGCRRRTVAVDTDPLMEVFRTQAQEEGLSRVETDGKRLFAQYCVTCHGDNGAGNGQNASTLDPRPPDFRTSLSAHPPAYWRQIIEGGSIAVGRSPLCPPRGRTLTSDDVAALVAYLGVLSRPAAQKRAPVGPVG